MERNHPAAVTLILVTPQRWDESKEDWVAATDDQTEYERAVAMTARVREVLERLGATTHDRAHVTVHDVDGCNYHGRMAAQTFFLHSDAVAKLEGEVLEREDLRRNALAKLSVREMDALGLFDLKTEIKYRNLR